MKLTTRRFRQLVGLQYVLPFVGAALGELMPRTIPDALGAANEKIIHDWGAGASPWLLVLFALVFAASLAATVGLYRFRPWGRTLSLILIGAEVVLDLLPNIPNDYNLSSTFETAFSTLSATLGGAMLAIAYFAPSISELFEQRRASNNAIEERARV